MITIIFHITKCLKGRISKHSFGQSKFNLLLYFLTYHDEILSVTGGKVSAQNASLFFFYFSKG